MVILNMATEKAKEKLQEYHSYQDSKVDRPLLTPDSVLSNET
jgi:hypothetical protein